MCQVIDKIIFDGLTGISDDRYIVAFTGCKCKQLNCRGESILGPNIIIVDYVAETDLNIAAISN